MKKKNRAASTGISKCVFVFKSVQYFQSHFHFENFNHHTIFNHYKSFSQQFQTQKSKWLGFLIAVIQATPTLKKKCFFPGFKWLKSFITRWPEKTFFVELWQSFELALIINLDVLYWFLSRPSTLFPTKQPARGCLKEMDLKI